MFRFTIRDVLLATTWIGLLLAFLAATYRLHQNGLPWWWHSKGWQQAALNVGIGFSLGGIVASFAKRHAKRAILLGLTAGILAGALWLLLTFWMHLNASV